MDEALQAFSSGRLDVAEARCREVLAARPRHAPALHLLGALAHRAGYLDDAIGLMQQAVAIEPGVAAYHSNLGVVLAARGLSDWAAAACRQALSLDPHLVDAHFNLGNALRDLGRLDDAAPSYRQALVLRSDWPQARNNLGNVLVARGHFTQAIGEYRQALALEPAYAEARSNLANALKDSGQVDEAVDEHRRAVESAPANAAIHSNLILCLQHRADVDGPTLADEARRWNARHAAPFAAAAPHADDRAPERSLHVGYVSANLRHHATAHFLVPLLEAHDRTAVRVTCYATDERGGDRDDPVAGRLRAASDTWRSLAGLSDDAAAQRIRDDRIDVLVDLDGHTRGHRLAVFARRPAPVQVTWLGYPGTTGVDAIDYRFTDALADPPDADDAATERLVRLASGAWCFAPLVDPPSVADPPSLRTGHATFGYFGNLGKITPDALATWAAILARSPQSRLALKSPALRDAETAQRFERRFAAHGIEAGRLDLLPDEPSVADHLRCYERIDVALDPFPYNGTTTTCEALWMGVPVVALAGRRHAARVGVSLLSNVGLAELVARDPADYVERAVALAADRPRLVRWRRGMRHRLEDAPLCDGPRFARHVESVYRELWRARCDRP